MQAVMKQSASAQDFSSFYQTHLLSIRGIIRKFNFHDAAADDLVQDIFIKAWKSLDQVDNHAAIGAWLKVIARNHCLNEIKNQRKLQRHLLPVETLPIEIEETVDSDIFELTPEQLDRHLKVLRELIIDHKDPVRREIARLFYIENQSVRDICLVTNMKQNTVLSHLRRFRLIVTKAMQRWMETCPAY